MGIANADFRVGLVAILAALTLAAASFAVADPAGAQTEGGAGEAAGTEHIVANEPPPIPPSGVPVFCAKVEHEEYWDIENQQVVSPVPDGAGHYELTGQGTYTGLDDDVVYQTAGAEALQFRFTATEDFWIAPEGTYTQDQCVAGSEVAGANGIDAEFTVYAPGSVHDGASEPCDGTGTFRRSTDGFIAEWELDEDCTVVGNVPSFSGPGTAPADTWHTFEGHLTPCEPVTCSTLEEAEGQLVGTYQQTLHDGSPLP